MGGFTRYLDFGCVSATGYARSHNEDNFYFFGRTLDEEHQSSPTLRSHATLQHLLTAGIFDGMGGETGGETASFAAATSLRGFVKGLGRWDEDSIIEAYKTMNRSVFTVSKAERAASMGTTAVILMGSHGRAWITNLGDSGAYLFSGESLSLITKPHTDAELLKMLGTTNRKPGVTQYLGIDPAEMTIQPYVAPISLKDGDSLLLCSDGLTDMVGEADIMRVLWRRCHAYQKACELRDLALAHGGNDNVTVLVCDASDSGWPVD